MSKASLHLEIVTPAGSKHAEDVAELTAPGILGELGVLPGHIPVLTVLDVGHLSFVSEGGDTRQLTVNGGFLEVSESQVVVLTESAEFSDEIDVERARAALERAEKALSSMEPGSVEYGRKSRSLKRAQSRLELASS
jgi:F-type H+-transporting ATPase subunit epsilon